MRNISGNRGRGLLKTLDWQLVVIYLLLILIGWASIYSSAPSSDSSSLFDFSNRGGKQFVWILASFGLAIIILFVINPRVFEGLSFLIYLFAIGLLLAVIVLGVKAYPLRLGNIRHGFFP